MILLILFGEFFKIGLFCFGGAFGMIPLIEETVLHYGWLPEERFYDLIGVCESTPGPIAVNMATYIGASQAGVAGAAAATLGVVLPSFIIILLIASVMKNLTRHRLFRGFLQGVQPVIIALILSTGLILLMKALGYTHPATFYPDWASILIFALLLGGSALYRRVTRKKIPAIRLILLSAVLGIAVCAGAQGLL